MPNKRIPSKAMRARYNAALSAVHDGVNPYEAFWLMLHPTEAMLCAERGDLPDGWRWEPEAAKHTALLQRQRDAYWAKKRKAA
jgi:hypothetical protein